MNIESLVRKNIRELKPYSTARDEFQGIADVYLDANENPYAQPYNRYPDPLQRKVKEKIASIKGIDKEKIFLGNGSDEAIDLVFRIFCEPAIDNVVAIDPTYGMYKVAAHTNHVTYRPVLLNAEFDFRADDLLSSCDTHTKLIFLCSPNNPSGNLLDQNEIFNLIKKFHGIVVLDEAYIDFASRPSLLYCLEQYPQLIILQTFSKAWGSAGIRLGMAFASERIINLMNKVKYPYNLNQPTLDYILDLLNNTQQIEDWTQILIREREWLLKQLSDIQLVEKIYPTDANFVLVKVKDADAVYQFLVRKSIIVRNRHSVSKCENCIRITVGTRAENEKLIYALQTID